MSQAQKLGLERDEEVWSFCNIPGFGMDAGRCTDEPQWFQCACAVVFPLEDQSRQS